MSETVMTPEEEIAKFKELKAVGFTNLKGEDRKVYQELKKKYPELDETGDDDGNAGSDETPAKPAKGEKVAKEPKAKKGAKAEPKTLAYVMKVHVTHNGDEYEKGAVIPENHEHFQEFMDKDFLVPQAV